jgi:hypothetical protein
LIAISFVSGVWVGIFVKGEILLALLPGKLFICMHPYLTPVELALQEWTALGLSKGRRENNVERTTKHEPSLKKEKAPIPI